MSKEYKVNEFGEISNTESGDEILRKKREELRANLLSKNKPNKSKINRFGETSGEFSQWYKQDIKLLEAEIYAMNKFFPNFSIHNLDDGQAYWIGEIKIYNIWWELKLIYDDDYPRKLMGGSSIKAYVISPNLEEMFIKRNWVPFHLLSDEFQGRYLHLGGGARVACASIILSDTIKWIKLFVLVINREMLSEDFDKELNFEDFKNL
jgi:hypothetical protein